MTSNRIMKTNTADVAIYARYSTDRQDARSIDDQMRRCRALADTRGFSIAAEYADAAVSGSHMDRVNLQRLIAAARRGSFRSVLVDDLSRLSRDLGDTWRIVFEDLASVGTKVIDVTTGMSSDADGARVTFGALALGERYLSAAREEGDPPRARGSRAPRLRHRRKMLWLHVRRRGEPAGLGTPSQGSSRRPVRGRDREARFSAVRRRAELSPDRFRAERGRGLGASRRRQGSQT